MKLNLFLIAASLFIGSTISKILASYFVFQKFLNLFSQGLSNNIPFFTKDIAAQKSFDIMEFIFLVLISVIVFLFLTTVYKNKKYSSFKNTIIGVVLLIPAVLFSIFTTFAGYSGSITIISIVLVYLTSITFSFSIPSENPKWLVSKNAIPAGILTGFYFLLVCRNITTSLSLQIILFAVIPIYFYVFSAKIKLLKSPVLMLLLVAFLFPTKIIFLIVLGVVTAFVLLITKNKLSSKIFVGLEKLFPATIIFLFLYNPIYYLGTFDPIEEGFWAGWLQRLIQGQFVYRDFAAYHPPLMLWGLFGFTKLFGASLINLRLYFHILQISGLIVIYLLLKRVIKSDWIRIPTFILIAAYSSTLVKNNMEIRIASGVLPLLAFYWFQLKNSKTMLFYTGIALGTALFVSLDTGIASFISLICILFFTYNKDFFIKIKFIFIGFITISLPLFGFLYLNHSIIKFIEYISFYPQTFSQGFQNLPIGQAIVSPLVEWLKVADFMNTSTILWKISEMSLVGSICYLVFRVLQKQFDSGDLFLTGITIFGLVLARSALGRSDYYHIVFVWIIALILMGKFCEIVSKYSISAVVSIFLIFTLFIRIDAINSFIQSELLKFQSYGNPSGQYPAYKNPRSGILTWIDFNTKESDDLINFIDTNTTKNQTIFVYPQSPETYFLSDRKNATSFDTPTAFYTIDYQKQMVAELKQSKPKLIIYNSNFSVAGISAKTLSYVDSYIQNNYKLSKSFGENAILIPSP